MAEEKTDNRALTSEDKEDVRAWLKKTKAEDGLCPSCGVSKWRLGAHFIAPPLYSSGIVLGGPAYPMFMLVCANCANTQFFNAVIAGVRRFTPKPPKDEGGNG